MRMFKYTYVYTRGINFQKRTECWKWIEWLGMLTELIQLNEYSHLSLIKTKTKQKKRSSWSENSTATPCAKWQKLVNLIWYIFNQYSVRLDKDTSPTSFHYVSCTHSNITQFENNLLMMYCDCINSDISCIHVCHSFFVFRVLSKKYLFDLFSLTTFLYIDF